MGLSGAMVLGMLGAPGDAQTAGAGQANPHPIFGDNAPPDQTMVHLQEQQAKTRNLDRQKRLEDDTAKLFALASELKDEVGKTNKDTMSLDVIKKADEIERLAHSVKEKMKG